MSRAPPRSPTRPRHFGAAFAIASITFDSGGAERVRGVNSSIEPQFAPASLRENDRAGHGVVAIVGSMSTDATLANVRGDVSELVKPGGLLGQQSADQGILRYRM